METIARVINLGVGVLKGLLFGILAINTLGVILAVAGFGLLFSGMIILAIPVGGLGLWIMLKTDDKL